MGYHLAGFTEIVGVDIEDQPHYPFTFVQADVMADGIDFDGFDLIHASPPCQAYSRTKTTYAYHGLDPHPELIDETREMLVASGVPYVIENVEGAPLRDPTILCGTEFGLSAHDPKMDRVMHLRRHRLFETSFWMMSPGGCSCTSHRGNIAGVYGGGGDDRARTIERGHTGRGGYTPGVSVRRELMGIDWMTTRELSEAIPPAYTQFIGDQFVAQSVGVW